MDNVARLSSSDRSDIFNETSARMGLPPALVEKDFWVCWILSRLFAIKEFNGWFVFKGGTSLSKCFNLIQRFSEDIDIAVDFEKLGFVGDKDPRQKALSNTKRAVLLDEMMSACHRYIANDFICTLTANTKEALQKNDWQLKIAPSNPNIVEFEYPVAVETQLDYVRPRVLLELGTHAEPVPNEPCDIKPFAAKYFPQLFTKPNCSLLTVVAKRTFWEKATILHAEYHRPPQRQMPLRYSRHYADVAAMS